MLSPGQSNVEEGLKEVPLSPMTGHPSDINITLPTHQPLYPPGQIIHIVRQHPKADRYSFSSSFSLLTITHHILVQIHDVPLHQPAKTIL